MSVPPPIEPRIDLLPLGDPNWEWKRFERFCLGLVEAQTDVLSASLYGKQGEKQKGIDIVANLVDGTNRTYQCRKRQRFTKRDAERTVEATEYEANEHVILVTCSVGTTARDYTNGLDGWTLWDLEDICRHARDIDPRERARRLVEDAFGIAWRRAFLGPEGQQAFLTVADYFAPFLSPDRLFRHTWELVGRESVISELSSAIDTARVVVVVGRGGIGKTRILRAVAESVGQARTVLVARDDAQLSDEAVDELPLGRPVVILDDVHRRSAGDLASLIGLTRRRDEPPTLVLATRPQRLDELRGELARGLIDASSIHICGPLSDLSFADTVRLAQQALGPSLASLAEPLAEATRDCPLVTVFGGLLLARDALSPALLERHSDFRAEVLERFTQERLGQLSREIDSAVARRLLDLLAALQPLSMGDGPTVSKVAEDVGIDPPELNRILGEMEDAGIVLARGRLRRIIPDVLADHILHLASVDRQGRSTGRASQLLDRYGDSALPTLMRNLAELDWRVAQEGDELDLLAGLWEGLRRNFETGDAEQRLRVIALLEPVAVFQPARILQIVEFALANPATTTTGLWGFDTTDDEVREKLPALLRSAAYSPEHTRLAMTVLWTLGRDDGRPLNQYYDHAIRVLGDLGSYELPLHYGRTLFGLVRDLAPIQAERAHRYSPLELLSPLLARQGTKTRSEDYGVQLGSYSVNAAAVAPLRCEVLRFLAQQTQGSDERGRYIATKLIGETLRPPIAYFGRSVENDARDQWLPEQRAILRGLTEIFDSSDDPVVRIEIREALDWHAFHSSWPEIQQGSNAILERALTLQDRVVLALAHPFNFSAGEDRDAVPQEVAEELIALTATEAASIVEKWQSRLDAIGAEKTNAGPLLYHLTRGSATYAEAIVTTALANPQSAIAPFAGTALISLREAEAPAYRDFLAKMQEVPELRRPLASYVAEMMWADDEDAPERAMLEDYLKDDDAQVLNLATMGIHRLAHRKPERAKPLILAAMVSSDENAADTLFAAVCEMNVAFSPEETDTLLGKLHTMRRLPYQAGPFLAKLALDRPEQVLDFILGRFCDERDLGSDAVPLDGLDGDVLGGRVGEAHIDLLRRVRDGSLRENMDHPGLARFYWQLQASMDDKLLVLHEWLSDGNMDEITSTVCFIEEINWRVLVARPFFVSDVLERASQVAEPVRKRVATALLIAANSGDHSRSMGAPAERDLTTCTEAGNAVELFAAGTLARQFFDGMRRQAEARITESRHEDEEMGER